MMVLHSKDGDVSEENNDTGNAADNNHVMAVEGFSVLEVSIFVCTMYAEF